MNNIQQSTVIHQCKSNNITTKIITYQCKDYEEYKLLTSTSKEDEKNMTIFLLIIFLLLAIACEHMSFISCDDPSKFRLYIHYCSLFVLFSVFALIIISLLYVIFN